MSRTARLLGLCVLALAGAGAGHGATTWLGATGRWDEAAQWSDGVPGPGSDAVIPAGSVLLTADSAALNSLSLDGGALVFSNWMTRLVATSVWINAGRVALPPAFTTNAGVTSNRIWIACGDLVLAAGARIDADADGYDGGVSNHVAGYGAGAAIGVRGGGAYGGFGGNYLQGGGEPWGSAAEPEGPGSGGARDPIDGGAGGGAIRIEAAGAVVVNGTITADGESVPTYAGAGSGGAIWITCRTFAGTSGLVRARGGSTGHSNSGSGGGGRIALAYDRAAQAAMPRPSVRFSARPGAFPGTLWPAGLGTLHLPDGALLSETLTNAVEAYVCGFASWSVARVTVSNGWIGFVDDGFRLDVTNELRIEAGGTLQVGRTVWEPGYDKFLTPSGSGVPSVCVGGSICVASGGVFRVCGGLTNETGLSALIAATSSVTVASGGVLSLASHPTTGGHVRVTSGSDVVVESRGRIDLDGRGYSGGVVAKGANQGSTGFGPGRGVSAGWDHGCGAGHGGAGGAGGASSFMPGGVAYDSVSAPLDAGSGGAGGANYYAQGGNGGGAVWIEAPRVLVNGTITADGRAGGSSYAGGGAGGSVYITCTRFAGTNGLVSADAGSGQLVSGGGGGGRISVVYDVGAQGKLPVPTVTFTAGFGDGNPSSWLQSNDRDNYIGNPDGGYGSLYFPDGRFLGETIPHVGVWSVPGFTNWSAASLTVTNGAILFPAPGFVLDVAGGIRIAGAQSSLMLSSATVRCGGSLGITNGLMVLFGGAADPVTLEVAQDIRMQGGAAARAGLYVHAGATNETVSYGALVRVGGGIVLASNAWIHAVSHPRNGGSPLIRAAAVRVTATNAGISADACGFEQANNGLVAANGLGPGRGYLGSGVRPSGAGYGGRGGGSTTQTNGGATYGLLHAPFHAGSSGGSGGSALGRMGGRGGGLVWLEVSNSVSIDGTISASAGAAGPYGGGGSGGGVLIRCRDLSGGPGAVLRANGGASGTAESGGGGGGRIAVWYGRIPESARALIESGRANEAGGLFATNVLPAFRGAVSVARGAGYTNQHDGTIAFLTYRAQSVGSLISVQ